MYYYDPNDNRSKQWAALAAAVYVLVLGTAFAFVSFDFGKNQTPAGEEILVEFLEPTPPPPPPAPPKVRRPEPKMHDTFAPEDNEQQVTGKDEQTRTVNPKALFKMNKGGADAPDNAGNPKAQQGEKDEAKGTGGGLNPEGNDQLDKGLQGRGLVGALPRPSYPGNKSGKVVIRVTVDETGRVTKAVYEPNGSTSSDDALVQAALDAAKKARFTESRSVVEGGIITYRFNLK
ncbi:MAG: TonB family protein [Rikenellaceae bacterium]|nr:TonB family protein [Rikenellaceae bacterium]